MNTRAAHRRKSIIAALVLAWPAGAADFRALDFGAPCDSIRAFEASQGSAPLPAEAMPGGELIAFEGRAFEREASIVYLCIGNRLTAGRYYLPPEPFEQVVASFGEVRGALTAAHGEPFLDTSPREADPDPIKYAAAWRTPRVRVSLSLVPRRGAAPGDWQVFVMTSANGG